MNMCNGNCGGKCGPMKIGKWLLVIGGLNWGLVGLGMLMGGDWNVVHMIFVNSMWALPVVEAIVYLLVGIAAAMKLFGCRCKKCMGVEAPAGSMDQKM